MQQGEYGEPEILYRMGVLAVAIYPSFWLGGSLLYIQLLSLATLPEPSDRLPEPTLPEPTLLHSLYTLLTFIEAKNNKYK